MRIVGRPRCCGSTHGSWVLGAPPYSSIASRGGGGGGRIASASRTRHQDAGPEPALNLPQSRSERAAGHKGTIRCRNLRASFRKAPALTGATSLASAANLLHTTSHLGYGRLGPPKSLAKRILSLAYPAYSTNGSPSSGARKSVQPENAVASTGMPSKIASAMFRPNPSAR